MKNIKFLSLYSILYILVGIISVNNIYIPINGYFSLWLAGGFGFIMLARYGKIALPFLWISNIILQFVQFTVYFHQSVDTALAATIVLGSGIKLSVPRSDESAIIVHCML